MTGPEDYFAGRPDGLAAFERVRSVVEGLGDVEVRTTKSQVAFRRRRGFAFLWLPGRYLRNPAAEVVLTIALGRHDPSPRWKEVVHPSTRQWIHHLELASPDDIDDEVRAWLLEAAGRAG